MKFDGDGTIFITIGCRTHIIDSVVISRKNIRFHRFSSESSQKLYFTLHTFVKYLANDKAYFCIFKFININTNPIFNQTFLNYKVYSLTKLC